MYQQTPPGSPVGMFIFYSYQDMGTRPPLTGVGASWINEELVFLRYARSPMQGFIKTAVDEFGDNGIGTVYKHYVPWERIARQLEANLADVTRTKAIGYLQDVLKALDLKPADASDAVKCRCYFDGWVDEAISMITDYPDNIFTGASSGDGAGTRIDEPDEPSKKLASRLTAASIKLNKATGVPLDKKHTISEAYKAADTDMTV
jgi:hypothetical protein